jgi:hypothetical protein
LGIETSKERKMVVQVGEVIHVITRRLFETEQRRHFAGVVTEVNDCLIRVKGYAFVFDQGTNDFLRRDEQRERLFSLCDAGLVINILPMNAKLTEIKYTTDEEGRRVVTDNDTFSLNMSEFGSKL